VNAVFELDDLQVRLGGAEILRGITLTIEAGQFTAIVGPNGAGKSTLMSVLSGFRREYQGSCQFLGGEARDWKKRELAGRLAFIPQSLRLEFPFTAEQVVFMGRTPYCNGLFESPTDLEAVRCAMRLTDTARIARGFPTPTDGCV
jgi:iron complex transport system ATP-binding protein